MANKKNKVNFLCSACGADFPKWHGQCPSCGEWGTLSEFKVLGNKNIKRSKVPINETDLHFAIRMDRRNIEYIYKHNLKSKPTKDFYKSVSQMYKRIMKSHPKHITGFAKTLK